MDLNTITVSDFKAYFRRDFPYLPVYDSSALYNSGARVYYPTTALFYDCKVNGTTGIVPTNTSNWTAVSDDVDNYIADDDISKAFGEAQMNFNQALFETDDQIRMAYFYLTAHYLAIDIRNSLSGIMANGNFPTQSKTAGSVSESFAIPTAYTANPAYAMLTQTGYGMKYLSLILPQMVGNVGIACGGTLP